MTFILSNQYSLILSLGGHTDLGFIGYSFAQAPVVFEYWKWGPNRNAKTDGGATDS